MSTRELSAERVITAGVELLAAALEGQAVDVRRVDWAPPVAGVEDALATVLLDPRRTQANTDAVAAIFPGAMRPRRMRRRSRPRGTGAHASTTRARRGEPSAPM